MINYMDLGEFREEGYLQESNRLFFHPRGLALQMTVEDEPVAMVPVSILEAILEFFGDEPEGDDYRDILTRTIAAPFTHMITGVWDYRDDPEGMVFGGELSIEKHDKVHAELMRHMEHRIKNLGYLVQPVLPGD